MNILDILYFAINLIGSILNYLQPSLSPELSTIKTTQSTSTVQTSILLSTITTTSNNKNSTTLINKSCPVGFVGNNCETECGLTYFPQNVKIVGGSVAIAHSWPAHVYVQICYGGVFYLPEFQKNYTISECYTCGGTLIDKTTVLTAGHCILNFFEFSYRGVDYSFPTWSNDLFPTNGSMYKLYLGIQNIDEMIYTNQDYVINASRVIRHENYDESYQLNDIALLKLSKPATLNQNVQIACLPTNRSSMYPPVNESVYAIGWGLTSENDLEISDELRNVKLTNYNGNMCDDVLPLVSKNWTIEMCAGEYKGGKDTCQGDSGGPLYYLDIINDKAKYVLVGITSFGDGCARYGLPGIYTRVNAYLDWINKNK